MSVCDFTSRKQCEEFGCGNIGYCKLWKSFPDTAKKGMTMEEMHDVVRDAQENRPFGISWDKIERMQGGRLPR